jgi:hypothetical protein
MKGQMQKENTIDRVLLFFLGFCFVSFIYQPALSFGQKVKTENGIAVVYNPREPVAKKGAPTQLILRPDLLIGQESGDERYVFSQLRSVQVDDQGNIYVLDWKDIKIKVFDGQGKHLRTFGKQGQGPGEIQMPTRMFLTRTGKLAILDSGNKRIAFYSPAGECLKEIASAKWSFIRACVDSRSYIYGDNFNFGGKGLSEKLLKFDPELNLVSTVSEVFSDLAPPRVNPLPDRFVYDILKDDSLIWAFTSKYELEIMNPEGKLLRKITKDYEPIKVTEEDRKKLIQERFGDSGVTQGITLEFPSHYSPVYSLLVDDHDRVFIRTNAKDMGGNCQYDVFGPDGICHLAFTLPENEIVMAVKKDKMYCLILENEAGIPQVKRYAMEWR